MKNGGVSSWATCVLYFWHMSDGFLQNQEAEPEVPVTPEVLAIAPGEEESPARADEKAFEQLPETRDAFLEAEAPTTSVEGAVQGEGATVAVLAAPAAPELPKDPVVERVEKVLEEGLGDFVAEMPEAAKERFTKKGKEVAEEIAGMVRKFRVTVKKTLKLIRDWLLTIPGVNKFFLEQESKIKTDRILELELAVREEKKNSV